MRKLSLLFFLLCLFKISCEETEYIIPFTPEESEEEIYQEEIELILGTLEKAIESDKPLAIYNIERCFSQLYEASSDEATKELVDQGLLPRNYLDILPTFSEFFKNYKDITIDYQGELEFNFGKDAEWCEVSLEFIIKAVSENEGVEDINFQCENTFTFTQEGTIWRILRWACQRKETR
jgi:hypothetical protein